jgi:hypothetical protein
MGIVLEKVCCPNIKSVREVEAGHTEWVLKAGGKVR